MAGSMIWNALVVKDAQTCANLCTHFRGSTTTTTTTATITTAATAADASSADSTSTNVSTSSPNAATGMTLIATLLQTAPLLSSGCEAFSLTPANGGRQRKCKLYNDTAARPAVRSDGSFIPGATFYYRSVEHCTVPTDPEKLFFEIGFGIVAAALAVAVLLVRWWKRKHRAAEEEGAALLGVHRLGRAARQTGWEWEGDAGQNPRWNAYPDRDCLKLNAYTAACGDVRTLVLNAKYRIDLAAMQQINVATGFTRRVRRAAKLVQATAPPPPPRQLGMPGSFPSVALLPLPVSTPTSSKSSATAGFVKTPFKAPPASSSSSSSNGAEICGTKWTIKRSQVTAAAAAAREAAGTNTVNTELLAQHFELALGKFALHGGCGDKVVQVDVYDSPARAQHFLGLQRRFEAEGRMHKVANRDKMHWAFHGTAPDAAADIMIGGFKVGGSEIAIRNGDVHGRGVYTARTAKTAVQYAGSRGVVILANALPGFQGKKMSDRGASGEVDSWTPNQDWVVFRTGSQLLPVYALHLRT